MVLAGRWYRLTLRPEHAGLEIGWTWLTPAAWKGGVNVEAKLLMLCHAFDELGCQRVEFATHERNERSRGSRGRGAGSASPASAARPRTSRCCGS